MAKNFNIEKIKKEFSKTTNIQEMIDIMEELKKWLNEVIEIKRNSLNAENENLKSLQGKI